jgi:hypothetical protein
MPNGYEAAKCSGCEERTVTVYVRELKPGANGTMPNSFWHDYRLCADCVRRCEETRAVRSKREPQVARGGRMRGYAEVRVYARTLEWLRTVKAA